MADWLESLREGAPKNAKLGKLLIFGPIVLLLLVVGVIVSQVGFTRRDPLELKGYRFDGLKKDKSEVYWTSQESLSIAGQLSWGPVLVQVGTLKFQAKANGRFVGSVPLKEGSNDLTILAGPEANQVTQKITVYCDRSRPQVKLVGEARGSNLILPSRVLRGKVSDDGQCELQVDGIEIELDEEGRFELKVKSSENAQKVDLLVTDQAGNKTSQSWTVWTKKSLKALTKKTLQRRKTWIATDALIQDLVIENVAGRLGDDYKWLRTETYNGPGDKSRGHRLATFLHKKTGVELQLLPGDRYQMGTNNPEAEAKYVKSQWPEQTYVDVVTQEIPAHPCLIEPFLMGRLELTQKQWDVFKVSDKRGEKGDDLPIDGTTWVNAKKWLKLAGGRLRLPSESEWEYACRGGTKTRFYWGDSLQFKYIWIYRNSRLRPRGAKLHDKAGIWNAFGLVDMSGNVAEWCEDPFTSNYKDGPNSWRPKSIDKDSVFSLMVVRGGNVKMKPLFSRTAARDYEKPDVPQPYVGFRVARSLPR
ncbi:MAG: SUMF1/EgtB/PvdO family nonheme iron enzyme [Planctomycetota bacterium]|nr:SUMF1/EgtB/PvdO family nonheme iron enzyme [Planctomycetota bacterium]